MAMPPVPTAPAQATLLLAIAAIAATSTKTIKNRNFVDMMYTFLQIRSISY
jgi:hypothetical protein